MKEKDLSKLSRLELLEILIEQSKEIDKLKIELDKVKQELDKKELVLKEAGSIAQASLQLNEVFSAAQKAADQYLESIYQLNKPQEINIETHDYSKQLLEKTQRECQQLENETIKYCKDMVRKAKIEIQDEWLAFNKYKEKYKR